MSKSLSVPSEKLGLPPGSLVHVGDTLEPETKLSIINYSDEILDEKKIETIEEILNYKDNNTVTWVIIEGLTDVDLVARVGKIFGIHHLVLEDILNTHQRPKFEEYDDHLYIVLKSLMIKNEQFSVSYEQISLIILNNFVLMFKEKKDDLFNPVIKQIKTSKGRLRKLGTDYLAYAILDTIVDQNFILIDSLDEKIALLEDELLTTDPTRNTLNTIQNLKREIIRIRKHVSPIRELVSEIIRSESVLIDEKTVIYMRDVYDHITRIIESIETYRDVLSTLLDIYISSVSNKMNEVMKVLTVFASIFIPLTFLTGIYGMNFQDMPELKWKWAYPFLWVLFISIPIALLVYFKRKKWL